MTFEIRCVSFAHELGDRYYPYWRVDFEIDGERRYRDVQAQEVYGAQHVICRELGVPFRPL